jgi:hypothetical protein
LLSWKTIAASRFIDARSSIELHSKRWHWNLSEDTILEKCQLIEKTAKNAIFDLFVDRLSFNGYFHSKLCSGSIIGDGFSTPVGARIGASGLNRDNIPGLLLKNNLTVVASLS